MRLKFKGGPLDGEGIKPSHDSFTPGQIVEQKYDTMGGAKSAAYKVESLDGDLVNLTWVEPAPPKKPNRVTE